MNLAHQQSELLLDAPLSASVFTKQEIIESRFHFHYGSIEIIEKEGCKPMDFTGKVMKGYVFVDASAVTTKKKLEYWIKLALEYNKIAKKSRKKK